MRWYDSLMEEGIELLTVEELMKTLRISRPTLYRLLKAGKLEPVRIGKRVLFESKDIRAFIDRSKTGETSKEEKKQKRKGPRKIQKNQEGQTEKPLKSASPAKQKKPRKGAAQPEQETTATKSEDTERQGRLL